MKRITCEMCGDSDLIKQDGVFVCQSCGMKYSVEEAKKMMIEGTVEVQGTVKVDNSAFVEKYLTNARRAYDKEDSEEVEKYYNMVEQNAPNNMEAVFFSAYGKTMLAMIDDDYYKKQQKFTVLIKSISVINDYYEITNEDKQAVLNKICDAIIAIDAVDFVYRVDQGADVGGKKWHENLIENVKATFVEELNQIAEVHDDAYIQELIDRLIEEDSDSEEGCYVATCVYGSYDCPQVWTLRRYRDYKLAESWYGRAFIHTYYAISPTLVKWFGHTKWFKKMWKGKLDKMVSSLQEKGYEATPYNDRNW